MCVRPGWRGHPIQGDTQVAPYVNTIPPRGVIPTGRDDDDAMEMAGHDHMFVRFHGGESPIQFQPLFFNHAPRVIQPHFTVNNIPE